MLADGEPRPLSPRLAGICKAVALELEQDFDSICAVIQQVRFTSIMDASLVFSGAGDHLKIPRVASLSLRSYTGQDDVA